MKRKKREKMIIFWGIAAVVITLVLCAGAGIFAVSESGKGKPEEDIRTAQLQSDAHIKETVASSSMEESKKGLAQAGVSESNSSERKESEPASESAAGEVVSETSGSGEQGAAGPLIVETDPAVYTYENMEQDLQQMKNMYEEMTVDSLGETMDGRQIYHVLLGNPASDRHVLITGSIHAREYMTTQLVMKQLDGFLKDQEAVNKYLGGIAVHVVPMINPDGVSISQFGLEAVRKDETRSYITDVIMKKDGSAGTGNYFKRWKANAHGVDLNRNFDALWDQYVGSGHPSSDHYKGEAPGSEPEAAALIRLTETYPFVRTVSYHTQGGVIYWYFGQTGKLKDDTEQFAKQVSAVTGYPLDANYQKLDPAGYKDWAISKKSIPSLTIEVGRETSPVPPAQFGEIWNRNSGVWTVIFDSAMK
ncbi:M14 family zinc carboxypeptidase [Clostridium sp. AM58-1XD]|uniref:M14 family zinc carboxypeptidase n=1 Tax=Clostridium sp. AM58-1XD TaxID=2292307 RepID=UPI000E4D14A4|nr:M14 family zinc carboxypeptidase [Clostridium sp. AM58-1XD]RGY99446.1 peptidase [Clostridium sp. AM58-1XD]